MEDLGSFLHPVAQEQQLTSETTPLTLNPELPPRTLRVPAVVEP